MKESVKKEGEAKRELEKITGLVKEMYKLQGIPVYSPLAPEWEELIKGGE